MAMIQANTWANDVDNGRAEMLVGLPVPRWLALLQTFAAAAIMVCLSALSVWAGVALGAVFSGLVLDEALVGAGALGLAALGLLCAAATQALGTLWRTRLVTSAMGTYIVVAFFLDLLGPLLHAPNWLVDLSIFNHFGKPVIDGPQWGSVGIMLALASALVLVALVIFGRSDLRQAG
jgi:ABC-2 type transport system permease protein